MNLFPRRTRHVRRLTLAGTAALALTATLLGPPADAGPGGQEIAGGLDNPRQLSFSNGRLFVAEAGAGGTGNCFPGPEGDDVCYGLTGAVTRIYHGRQQRVVKNLPSLAGPGGGAAIGPADVSVVHRNRFAVTIGLGANPAVKEELPRRGRRLMGTIATGRLWTKSPRVAADLAAYEARTDKDGLGPDSNPTGLIRHRGGFVATDSGANTLVRAGTRGWVKALAVFGSPGTVPNPFDPTEDVEVQPVPTSVAVGPDGAFYVSELTGFPFAPGLSRIHRVVPGMPTQVYATGLTNVTDLAWHGGHLYAVQLADEGLLSAPEGELPMGSLVRVDTGGDHEAAAGPFPAPYGVAIRHDWAYVTTCSVCPDAGAVVKVPLS
jgi:hypothetical protein